MNKIAFLVSHPTQFEVPFYKYQYALFQSKQSELIFDVYYLKTASVKNVFDAEIGRRPGWDFDDREGYRYFHVPLKKAQRTKYFLNQFASMGYHAIIINGYVKNDISFHLVYAKLKRIPLILRLDSVLLYEQSLWKKTLKKFILPKFFRLFDAFLAVGSLTRQALHHYGVQDQKIFLFPYAVDNDHFAAESRKARDNRPALRERWGLPRDGVVFMAVIKFVPREGVLDLLNAFAQLKHREPKAVLLLVGDGPLRQDVEEMLNREKLTNVVWVGYQPYSQLPLLYGISDVFIHPPHQECWGVSVNEAMACGLPIILSDMVGSGADLLDRNGLFYKAGNVPELADCLVSLTNDPEGRLLMGRRSQAIVQKWGFQKIIVQLQEMAKFLKMK